MRPLSTRILNHLKDQGGCIRTRKAQVVGEIALSLGERDAGRVEEELDAMQARGLIDRTGATRVELRRGGWTALGIDAGDPEEGEQSGDEPSVSEQIVAYLEQLGPVEDEDGKAASILVDTLGASTAYVNQCLRKLEGEYTIEREIRGKRTYRIALVGQDVSQEGDIEADNPTPKTESDKVTEGEDVSPIGDTDDPEPVSPNGYTEPEEEPGPGEGAGSETPSPPTGSAPDRNGHQPRSELLSARGELRSLALELRLSREELETLEALAFLRGESVAVIAVRAIRREVLSRKDEELVREVLRLRQHHRAEVLS